MMPALRKNLIPLSEWLESLRSMLEDAEIKHRHRAAQQPSALGFKLEEISLDAEVVTGESVTGSGGIEFFVVKAGVEGVVSQGTSQRISLKFSPKKPLVLGNGGGDAFSDM